jgi:hypothetical protein
MVPPEKLILACNSYNNNGFLIGSCCQALKKKKTMVLTQNERFRTSQVLEDKLKITSYSGKKGHFNFLSKFKNRYNDNFGVQIMWLSHLRLSLGAGYARIFFSVC